MYIYIIVNSNGYPIAVYDCPDKATLALERYYRPSCRIKKFPILTNFLQKDSVGV